MIGTVKWSFQDNTGKIHTFQICDALLVPQGTIQLLSPQHFTISCENVNVHKRSSNHHSFGIGTSLYGEKMENLRKKNNSCASNVPTFYSSPSNKVFKSFAASIEHQNYDDEHVVFKATCNNESIHDKDICKKILPLVSDAYFDEQIKVKLLKDANKVKFKDSEEENWNILPGKLMMYLESWKRMNIRWNY